MIQRIQTVYLLAAIICLSIVSFSKSILIYFFGTSIERYELTMYGIFNQEGVAVESNYNLPLYFITVLLIPLLVLSIFSFKNLNRQALLTKISMVLYGLLIAAVLIIHFFNDLKLTVMIGSGFYILAIGLPFLFLANNGINRDKKLIDSLNRLR